MISSGKVSICCLCCGAANQRRHMTNSTSIVQRQAPVQQGLPLPRGMSVHLKKEIGMSTSKPKFIEASSAIEQASANVAGATAANLKDGITRVTGEVKALTSVKSIKDAFELQSSFARSAMEKSLAESGKLTDASFKLTEQALAPITARVSVAVEKLSRAA